MLFFQKPFVIIQFDERLNLAHVKWFRFENSYEYREGLEQVITLAEMKRPRNWVFDLQQMSAVRPQDHAFTINEHLPLFFETLGSGNLAVIFSEDFFSSASIGKMGQAMNPSVHFRINSFKTLDEAMQWLTSLPN